MLKTFLAWLCFVFLAPLSSLSAEEKQPPRIAILSSNKSAWGDLLMARLSKDPAVSLVERDDLGKALDEIELKELLGDRKQRSRFGEIAGADFLALLDITDNRARLVVCDTHLGVTLQDLSIGISDQSQKEALEILANTILHTIQYFAHGVKQIVAVPSFVCRDLTFDFIYLQSDYAEVLRSAYRQIPGLAIVAIEEAKAIAAERDMTGLEQKERIVSIFIEGEYRTKRDPQNGGISVEITLRARDAAKVLMERKIPSVSTSQAGKEMMSVFTKDLAALTQLENTKIDESAQYRMLIERADEFSKIGEFLRSTDLREAALLLMPDADDQRVKLVREYTRHNLNPYETSTWPKGSKSDDSNLLWVTGFKRSVTDWKRSLQHCEYLILNRRLNREEAAVLTNESLHSITGVRVMSSDRLGDCEAFKKDFMRHVFPRASSLDLSPRQSHGKTTGATDFYEFSFQNILFRCDGNFFNADDLDFIADLLVKRFPEATAPSYNLNFFLRDVAYGLFRDKSSTYRFTQQQYLSFLDQLLASKHPMVRVYGRYGKVCLRHAQGEKSPALKEEAQGMVDAAKAVGFDLQEYDYYMNQLEFELTEVTYELQHQGERTVSLPPQKSLTPSPTLTEKPESRVSLEPIPLRLANPELKGKPVEPGMAWQAGGSSGINGYRPLADGLDAFWSRGAVFLMHHRGELVQVLADDRLSVEDVVYDGKYVWVASLSDWGLSVLDQNGRELTRIDDKQGLPPRGLYGLVVHPIESGRVLVSGSFGNEGRGWIAVVQFDGSTSKVEVILEATKVWDYKDRDDRYSTDPTKTFAPQAVIQHVIPGPKPRRVLFILRRNINQPLMVDIESLKVSVYPANSANKKWFPRCDPPANAFLSHDGILWVAGSMDDFCSFRFDEQTALFDGVRVRENWHAGNGTSGSLAIDGDWLYYAGYRWRRINLKTGHEELLVNDIHALPHYGSGGAWSLYHSTHYGHVAFFKDKGELYHVKITPDESTQRESIKHSSRVATYTFLGSTFCLVFLAGLYRRRKRPIPSGESKS